MKAAPVRGAVREVVSWLRLQSGDPEQARVELQPGVNVLGRAESADVQIDHATVSEQHCQIEVTSQGSFVRDLGSTNGTFVDDLPVTQTALQPGQRLRLGEVELLFGQSPGPDTSGLAPTPSPIPARSSSRATPLRCANHPPARAVWICTDCQRQLCAACITQVKLETGHAVTVCKSCHGFCERLDQEHLGAHPPKAFARGLLAALGYPLKGDGIFMLAGAALLQMAIGMLGVYALILSVAVGAYLLDFLRQILIASTRGESAMPKWPDFDLGSIKDAFIQFFGVSLVCFGPGILCRIWLAADTQVGSWVHGLLMVGGGCYFPMALLGVVIYDDLAALNPLRVILSILKVPIEYGAMCLSLGALLGLGGLIDFVLAQAGLRLAMSLVGTAASFYMAVAAMRIVGWFYFCCAERLGWR